MKTERRSIAVAIRRALFSGAVVALAGTASVQAQEAATAPTAAPEEPKTLETVSVLGSRTKPRTEASSRTSERHSP